MYDLNVFSKKKCKYPERLSSIRKIFRWSGCAFDKTFVLDIGFVASVISLEHFSFFHKFLYVMSYFIQNFAEHNLNCGSNYFRFLTVVRVKELYAMLFNLRIFFWMARLNVNVGGRGWERGESWSESLIEFQSPFSAWLILSCL